MDKKIIQSGLVDAAREVVGADATAQDIAYHLRKAKMPRGMALKNVDVDAGRVHFSLASFPWSYSDWTLRTDFGNRTDLEMSLRNTQYYTSGIAETLGLTGKITPGSWGVNNNNLLNRKVKASLHRKRLSSLPKIIEGLIDASGAEKQADYIEAQMRLKAKAKVVEDIIKVSMPSPWTKEARLYYTYTRSIAVKRVRLGQFSVAFKQEGTAIVITAKVDSSHEALKSAEKQGKINGSRYRTIEAGQKALVAAANKLVKELRGPVEAVAKKFAQQEMTKNKWLDAIDKRANTAYRGAKPYKDNNAKRRGYVVFEVKAGGRAIYYVAIGIKKIAATNKGMTGVAYVRLGTYEDSLKKYLKIGDGEIFEDYFNESESFASKNVEFRVMADITKTFKGLISEVKRAIMMAKTEGKEATPDTAAFLTRKERKVSGKRYDREREREKIHERKNIDVYHENGKRGLDWSAASHDQGYAERVVGGFSTMDEAKDYIIEDVGGGRDWVVVYGTQMDGKRLGRVEEDYDDDE